MLLNPRSQIRIGLHSHHNRKQFSHCPRSHSSRQEGVNTTPVQNLQAVFAPSIYGKRRSDIVCEAASLVCESPNSLEKPDVSIVKDESRPDFRVVIAGAGIAGLTLALGLLKQGIQVRVLERDLTAVRGEGKIRGPIQIQSNALAALEAIDLDVADKILENGCVTGDRINGLCDGTNGDWYCKFDTFHPAVHKGLPITRVINRVTLQQILADAVLRLGGPETIQGNSHVVSYDEEEDSTGSRVVAAKLQDGGRVEGDVLVGTDGIWSKIRTQLLGNAPAHYSEYTCYTGISDYVPADIDIVGYRVYLGSGQYFVCSDVGEGKVQWYAFHKEPAGGGDPPGQRKKRLLDLFGSWNYNVVDLIKTTPEADVLRRDIYDRVPVFNWVNGHVALLGDSVHAMQPNLGQGGCMAIEDAYQLSRDLGAAVKRAFETGAGRKGVAVQEALHTYQGERMMRVAAIHGLAGMAAFMAGTYKTYLGEGAGPLSSLAQLRIPHPGKVAGQFVIKFVMPAMLGWVMTGNCKKLEECRDPHCRIGDQPRAFHESEFEHLMSNDQALLQRVDADWLLVSEREAHQPDALPTQTGSPEEVQRSGLEHAFSISGPAPSDYKGVYLNLNGQGSAIVVGSAADCHLLAHGSAARHACIYDLGDSRFELKDLGTGSETWLNERLMKPGSQVRLQPGDRVRFGTERSSELFLLKLQHPQYRSGEVNGHLYKRVSAGAMVQQLAT